MKKHKAQFGEYVSGKTCYYCCSPLGKEFWAIQCKLIDQKWEVTDGKHKVFFCSLTCAHVIADTIKIVRKEKV